MIERDVGRTVLALKTFKAEVVVLRLVALSNGGTLVSWGRGHVPLLYIENILVEICGGIYGVFYVERIVSRIFISYFT